ncbi:hypothetical protein ABK040_009607 [Willaertia magna]
MLSRFREPSLLEPFFTEPFQLMNMSTFLNEPLIGFDERMTRNWKPACDISETNDNIKVVCNLPGLRKEDVRVDLDDANRTLTISGEFKKEDKQENETFHKLERVHGSFMRNIVLPKNVKLEDIKANMENGVLRIIIPKVAEESKTKSIDIQ